MLLSAPLIRDPSVTSLNRLDISGRRPDPDSSVSLDGRWEFKLLERPEFVVSNHLRGSRGSSDWQEIDVPGPWTLQGEARRPDGRSAFSRPVYTNVIMPFVEDPPAVPDLNPTGVYCRRVEVPGDWMDRRMILCVGAAESVLHVFVDGHMVGGSTDSRLPAEFDLSDYVAPGKGFDLALVVTRWSAQSWLEDQDQWWHAGIQRSVVLYSRPQSHLASIQMLSGVQMLDGLSGEATGTLEAEARVVGPAVRSDNWSVEVEVGALDSGHVTQIATSGRVRLPHWDDSSEAASLLSGTFVEPGVVRVDLDVPKIRPWSHEDPHLYSATMTLRDGDRIVDVEERRIGFRSVEVTGNELLINGIPVLIHGVNLHEHSPETGRYVTREQTRQDLLLMKAHNLNAIRAAHYPHDEHLAELCDELGLYLVDEANVESHARQASLCHDARFTSSIFERVRRMVERDHSHPSIIIWSLGNESGYGAVHDAAAAWIRRRDPSRPVQYEGPLMFDLYAAAPATDIVCPMYSEISDIVAWARSGRDELRPLILCEYSHAMGNSNGSLADYWEAFETESGLQGGFIWEWVDHGLYLYDEHGDLLIGPDGRPSWGYGGDFGDIPNDANFVCDGLVAADRNPRPGLAEVRFVGRPLAICWAEAADSLSVEVTSRRWFTDTSDLEIRWELLIDGVATSSHELDFGVLGPRASTTVDLLDDSVLHSDLGVLSEVHLRFTTRVKKSCAWATAGSVVAVEQLEVDMTRRVALSLGGEPGGPEAQRSGPPLVAVGEATWQPTVFRALTDNDGIRIGWMRGLIGNLARWVDQLELDKCDFESGGSPHKATSARVEVRSSVLDHASGWRRLQVDLDIPESLDDLPRVGIEMTLTPTDIESIWEHIEWFGDGPHDSYPDRRASAIAGRWASSIDSTYVEYALPQEHGHHEGLRWLALRTEGHFPEGLIVACEAGVGGVRPGFAVRRHSDRQLWNARHAHELVRPDDGKPATYLYVDIAQRGLGTASCGPDALDRYRISHGEHRLVAWLRRFDPDSEDPGDLYALWRNEFEGTGSTL